MTHRPVQPNPSPPPVQRFPWRNPLWACLNLLPVALAAITIRVFGSATIALFRTTLAAPPAERNADLGLALIALATVAIAAAIAAVFCNLMLVPGWRHPGDTIEIHPDRLSVVDQGRSRDIPWDAIAGDPVVEIEPEVHGKRFLPRRVLVVPVRDQDSVRIPDGHLHFREIATAIARARAAHSASPP